MDRADASGDSLLTSDAFIARHWLRRSLVSFALLPFAWLYGAVLVVRSLLYQLGILRIRRMPVPVVVVGNFLVGGTGKTPLVIWLCKRLREAGMRVGIVSRGHGGTERGPCAVNTMVASDRVGDEPVLLAERLKVPVWIGRDRAAAAAALLAAHPDVDVVVCDDGLQHLALGRDIEIAVMDQRDRGNGFLLPAGPLRERPRKVDALVRRVGQTRPGEFAMALEPAGIYRLDQPDQSVSVETFADKRVCAIAGIGVPQRFFDTLAVMGIRARCRAFPDHHRFVAQDLDDDACEVVLMTEKDAVKCRAFARSNLYALRVEARIDQALADRVIAKLRSLSR